MTGEHLFMPNYKGAALVFIRMQFSQRDASLEKQFLQELSPDEQEIYHSCISSSWIPITIAQQLLEKSALFLYPDLDNPLQQLGFDRAQNHLTGIYRAILRISSPTFVIKQAAKIWTLYYDQGQAHTAFLKNQDYRAVMKVEDFPELPITFRDITSGYILGAVELTGAKDIRLVRDDADPSSWKWYGSWK